MLLLPYNYLSFSLLLQIDLLLRRLFQAIRVITKSCGSILRVKHAFARRFSSRHFTGQDLFRCSDTVIQNRLRLTEKARFPAKANMTAVGAFITVFIRFQMI